MNTMFNNNAFGTAALQNPNAEGMGVSTLTPLTNATGATVAYLTANPNARLIQGAPEFSPASIGVVSCYLTPITSTLRP